MSIFKSTSQSTYHWSNILDLPVRFLASSTESMFLHIFVWSTNFEILDRKCNYVFLERRRWICLEYWPARCRFICILLWIYIHKHHWRNFGSESRREVGVPIWNILDICFDIVNTNLYSKRRFWCFGGSQSSWGSWWSE